MSWAWLQSWGYRFRFLGMLGSLEWWHCDRPNKAGSLVTSSVPWPLVSHSQYSGVASVSLMGGYFIYCISLNLQISLAIFWIHIFHSNSTDGGYSQSISVYAPDMTPGNGHRTQNRASLCHSPGGWDYTSTEAPDLAGAVSKAGDWNKKMQIFTQQSLYNKNVGPE